MPQRHFFHRAKPADPTAGKPAVCRTCPYYTHPMVENEGPDTAEIMLVGDSPWKTEEEKGRPFQGPAGLVLDTILDHCGLDRNELYVANSVKCRPNKLGEAYPAGVVETCVSNFLLKDIQRLKPRLIVPMGNTAMAAFTGATGISKARGALQKITWRGLELNILPTFHPSYINKYPAYTDYAGQDFKAVKYYSVHNAMPPENKDLDYRGVMTTEQLEDFFALADKTNVISWDLETTGLDYRSDEILCMSFSFQARTAHALMLYEFPVKKVPVKYTACWRKDVITRLYDLLHSGKTFLFHNGKFDHRMLYAYFKRYSRYTLDIQKINWYDTRAMYALLDENTKQTLKEIAKLHTDLRYSAEELKMVKGGQLKKLPLEKVIEYACLSYESRVVLADGSTEKISKLVQQRYAGEVRCFDVLKQEMTTGRVVGWHRNIKPGQRWYKILTPTTLFGRYGSLGAFYTPEHEIYTQRGKVRVMDLRIGHDKILTDEVRFTQEQMSVFLGCLLGDGGIHSKNDALAGFRFGQTFPHLNYAAWKASVFQNFNPKLIDFSKYDTQKQHQYDLPYSRYMSYLLRHLPLKSREEHRYRKVRITPKVLSRLGILGLAVWYQDDGSLAADSTRISATKVTNEEVVIFQTWMKAEFGIDVKYYKSRKQRGIFVFTGDDEVAFHRLILPYIHPDCHYKSLYSKSHAFAPYALRQAKGVPFYELITGIREVRPKLRTENVRWCISVETHDNFLTLDGIVSNSKDADATRRIGLKFRQALLQRGLWPVLKGHDYSDMEIANNLFESEIFGAPIDVDELIKLEQSLEGKIERFRQRMITTANHKLAKKRDVAKLGAAFNPRSPDQLRKLLFEQLAFPAPEKRTGKGKISTDKEVVDGLIQQFPDDEFMKMLKLHRDHDSIYKTFAKGFHKKLADDGRLHPDFAFTSTVSGRVVCYKPNLANIPRDKELEPGVFISIRGLFVARPGWRIGYRDYAQIEFKCAALLSGDKKMIRALFVDHEDFHSLVARGLYPGYQKSERRLKESMACLENLRAHKIDTQLARNLLEQEYKRREIDRFSHEELFQRLLTFLEERIKSCEIQLKTGRTRAKNFNFGRIYGGQRQTLARALGLDPDDPRVDEFIDRLASTYPDFETYLSEIPEMAVREGQLISPYGRVRHFPFSLDERVQSEQGRQGGNFGPQSSAAYVMRAAFSRIAWRFKEEGLQARQFNIVYDSNIDEHPLTEEVLVSKIVAQEMLKPVPQLDNAVFAMEMGNGRSWKEAEHNAVKIYDLVDAKKYVASLT